MDKPLSDRRKMIEEAADDCLHKGGSKLSFLLGVQFADANPQTTGDEPVSIPEDPQLIINLLESEVERLRAEIEILKARKCSHGDYRMYGTTDCRNETKCGGRTELYVIGEGLCLSCNLTKIKELEGT